MEKKKIPKILHFCWFGRGEKNKTIKKCMGSWKKHCKNYKFMEWNEDTFDIKKSPVYVQQAYEMKKWAFVSDYVRLWVLNKYGGIYVDTDVEIIKSLDKFLYLEGFSGFSEITEGVYQIPAALMGAISGNGYIRYLLSYYNNRNFILKDGKLDIRANITIITKMTLSRYKFVLDNSYQKIPGYNYYPTEFFTPKFKHYKHIPMVTKNTHAIHYHNESWMSPLIKLKINLLIVLSYSSILIGPTISNNSGIKPEVMAITPSTVAPPLFS